jgi:hypothetical protein
MRAKTRITAFVREDLAKAFTETMSRIGVSGSALLARGLPSELNYLAELPSNSERGEAVGRSLELLAAADSSSKKRRLNITLERADAERMDQLCREKRVPRDFFIGGYLAFLVNGQDGVCEAPLKRIGALLMNPRLEFEEKRKSGSAADTTLYDMKDESFTFVEAVPRENPYSSLHLDEEEMGLLERVVKDMKKRTPEIS